MAVARTIEDVLLGEAAQGTVTDRWTDMVAIASAMQNRAQLSGKSLRSIVTAPGEFSAYNRRMPDGVERYRRLARAALAHVEKNGPVHGATYYATPAATKNLPGGLKRVSQTAGHVFFEDPQGRAFQTADGYVRPRHVASLPATAPLPSTRPAGPQEGAPASRRPGMAALAPNGLREGGRPGSMTFYHEGQDTIAPQLADALTGLSAERGRDLGVTSGYRSPARNSEVGGTRGSLHMRGMAADIDMTGWSVAERQRAVSELAQRGAGGFITYTNSPDMMHVDMRPRPKGAPPHFMHDKSARNMAKAPGWFREAAASGGHVLPRTMDAPPSRSAPPLRPSQSPVLVASSDPQMAFAAVSERANVPGKRPALSPSNAPRLSPAPASRLSPTAPDRVAGVDVTGERTMPSGPLQPPEPVVASRYTLGGPVSLPPDRPMPGAPLEPISSQPLSNAIGRPPTGKPVKVDANKLRLQAQTVARAASQPGPTLAPSLPAPTLVPDFPVYQPPPLNPMQAAVDAAPYRAPEPDIPRGAQAAYDFYNGQNDQAFASTGEALNRDRHGNTYLTNKFGVTTGTDPRGNSFRASSIPGPLGNQEAAASGGILSPDWDRFADRAKPRVAEALGAGLGGMLGPVAALAGGLLGRELAKPGGGRVGDFLRDTRTVDTSRTPFDWGLGRTERFARPQGGLAFPTAPGGGNGAPQYSDRDYSRMERVSPQAAKDIKSGRSGLY